MNEQGWGIKDVFIFLAIVCLAILVSMALYRRTFSELFGGYNTNNIESETYYSIEEDLKQTAHTYLNNYYYKILEDGDEGAVSIRDMQNKQLLTVVKDINDDNIDCSGYVYFKKINGITNYKTYLNCGNNYQTEGYQSKYDKPVKKQ